MEVANEVASGQQNWSPPLASPTTTPVEDTGALPSFKASFASVAPTSPNTTHVPVAPPSTHIPSHVPTLANMSTLGPVPTNEHLPSTSASASSTSSSGDNLNSLTDQLYTMRDGFIERLVTYHPYLDSLGLIIYIV